MRPLLLSVALLSAAFAPAPLLRPERRPSADPCAAMRGDWDTIRVTADRMICFSRSGTDRYVYALTVDASVRPARFTLTGVDGAVRGRKYCGIWRVEGDTLTLCYNAGRDGYPTAFEGPGKGKCLDVHKRKRR
jgi:uncharacterized protein (TIGR03067 family)